MCTCNAFTYRSCRYWHARFEPVDVCLAARLGLREKCQERIVNGRPDRPRAFPVIDDICDVCFPGQARAEQEEKERAEAEKKEKEAREVDNTPAFAHPALELFPSASDFEMPEGGSR
ncbi:hypothetical protein SAMD00023353_0500810 [Rosellinia necatrix]|uniref:Uncharacterized protein n=1 Tax=Rosellinia necatrix TaxID=77044 RepID=A0A1S8A5M2_ROSNE|nr:hypothetical protein SAMD00023353_0500810 [Rosellinia necatrix]